MSHKLIAGSPTDRLSGIEPLLAVATDMTVLDTGCHKGYVAFAFASNGASQLYGFDQNEECVETARSLLADFPIDSRVEVADLAKGLPVSCPMRFDIVLYLGVHHHLAKQCSSDKLTELVTDLVDRSGTYFACRTSEAFLDEIDVVARRGALVLKHHSDLKTGLNPVRIYVRS